MGRLKQRFLFLFMSYGEYRAKDVGCSMSLAHDSTNRPARPENSQ